MDYISALSEKWVGQHWTTKFKWSWNFLSRKFTLTLILKRFTKFLNHESLELYGTTFLYLQGNFLHNLIGWCANYLTCTRLPYHKPLSFTHRTFEDLLSTPPVFWSPAINFKLLAESIATASQWCEDVPYLPDPPFLFGGGSGDETSCMHVVSVITGLLHDGCQITVFVKWPGKLSHRLLMWNYPQTSHDYCLFKLSTATMWLIALWMYVGSAGVYCKTDLPSHCHGLEYFCNISNKVTAPKMLIGG